MFIFCRILLSIEYSRMFALRLHSNPFYSPPAVRRGPLLKNPSEELCLLRLTPKRPSPRGRCSPCFSKVAAGDCRKTKSNIIKSSLGQSRSLCVQQWCFISWRKPPQNPHSCAFNTGSTSVLSCQWHQQSPEPNQNGTTPHSLQRIRENLIQ